MGGRRKEKGGQWEGREEGRNWRGGRKREKRSEREMEGGNEEAQVCKR